MQGLVDLCNQSWVDDIYCSIYAGGQWIDIRGAYMVGSEIVIAGLDGYIDRMNTGEPPPGAISPYDFSMYLVYVEQAWWDSGMPYDRPYWVLTNAALNYSADIDMSGGIPAANNKTGKSAMDVEFEWAKMILAHTLVAWQSPEWENGQADIDVLGPNNIEPFVWDPGQTPTFMYWLKEAVEYILDIPVAAEQTTWGVIKNIYSQEDN